MMHYILYILLFIVLPLYVFIKLLKLKLMIIIFAMIACLLCGGWLFFF